MRVLILQPSHLGDIILTFPALSDARVNLPNAIFDWAVKKAFLEVPTLHRAVNHVIPLSQVPFSRQRYDIVIDTHGMIKTGLLTWLSRIPKRIGRARECAREGLASVFYQNKIGFSRELHATQKARIMLSEALSYPLPNTPLDYGVAYSKIAPFKHPKPYWVFLHGASRQNKQWPESHWIELARWVTQQEFDIYLLWGNDYERDRALRIRLANDLQNQVVVPDTIWNLHQISRMLLGAQQVIGLDTGLTHLCAALGVKTTAIYGSYDPKYFGNLGKNQSTLLSTFLCAPCSRMRCHLKHNLVDSVPCMNAVSPENLVNQECILFSIRPSL